MDLRELGPDSWPALERLFGPNGAVAGCWCTWFMQGNKELAANGSAGNREILRARMSSGTPVGLLAMDGEDARGWVAIGCRTPRAGATRLTIAVAPGSRWSAAAREG